MCFLIRKNLVTFVSAKKNRVISQEPSQKLANSGRTPLKKNTVLVREKCLSRQLPERKNRVFTTRNIYFQISIATDLFLYNAIQTTDDLLDPLSLFGCSPLVDAIIKWSDTSPVHLHFQRERESEFTEAEHAEAVSNDRSNHSEFFHKIHSTFYWNVDGYKRNPYNYDFLLSHAKNPLSCSRFHSRC